MSGSTQRERLRRALLDELTKVLPNLIERALDAAEIGPTPTAKPRVHANHDVLDGLFEAGRLPAPALEERLPHDLVELGAIALALDRTLAARVRRAKSADVFLSDARADTAPRRRTWP